MGRIFAVVGAAVAVAASFAAPAPATVPGANGKIAFTSSRSDLGGNAREIYVVNPDGSGERRLTFHPDDDRDPAWSPDGKKIAFIADRDIYPYNQYPDLWIMDADGSNQVRLTPEHSGVEEIEWFPGGSRILFLVRACHHEGRPCGLNSVDPETGVITPQPMGEGHWGNDLAWSPYGEPLAYVWANSSVHTLNPDGSGHGELKPGGSPFFSTLDWSPDGGRLVSSDGLGKVMTLKWPSGDIRMVANSAPAWMPTWSPDATRFAFTDLSGAGAGRIGTMRTDGTDRQVLTAGPDDRDPDWQALDPASVRPGYPRPKSASPVRVNLVPAYEECLAADANRSHGPPLPHPSCNPPQQTSPFLTVGTPDANGQAPLGLGRAKFRNVPGDPDTTADEADVGIELLLVDVRCRFNGVPTVYPCNGGPLSDYLGEVVLKATVRITDKPPTGLRTGTMRDLTLRSRVTCNETPDAPVGSTCALVTTMDSLIPGAVVEGRRSVWMFDAVEVLDGGPDGEGDTQDGDKRFARQGVFVP